MGILRGQVVSSTPSVDRHLGALHLTPPPTPGIVVAFSHDISQGLVRLNDGRAVFFKPGIFYSSVEKPRKPIENEAVHVHFGPNGEVTAVVARPPKLESLLKPTRAWYDYLLSDDDFGDGVDVNVKTTTEWFTALDRSDRKDILATLHQLRSHARTLGGNREKVLEELLRHLEDDHETAKSPSV